MGLSYITGFRTTLIDFPARLVQAAPVAISRVIGMPEV